MTNLAAVAIGFGMMAQSIVVPQLLQMPEATGYGLGQSILAAGLWMAPAGLMMMVFAPVSSGLIRSIGAKHTLMIGATVLGSGYLVALVLMDAPWQLLVASCVASAGVGIGYAAMPTLILDSSRPRGRLGSRRQRPDALGRHHPRGGGHGHPAHQQHDPARRLRGPHASGLQVVLRRRCARRVRRCSPRRDGAERATRRPRVATGSSQGRIP